jgi:hypothetical protein
MATQRLRSRRGCFKSSMPHGLKQSPIKICFKTVFTLHRDLLWCSSTAMEQSFRPHKRIIFHSQGRIWLARSVAFCPKNSYCLAKGSDWIETAKPLCPPGFSASTTPPGNLQTCREPDFSSGRDSHRKNKTTPRPTRPMLRIPLYRTQSRHRGASLWVASSKTSNNRFGC